MADKIHCIRKTLRLMPQEAEMLAKKAGERGMCEAYYLIIIKSSYYLSQVERKIPMKKIKE